MKNILGLRTIKTGLAVTVSVIVAQLLKIEYPFFVAMTAIISMDKTMGNSFKMGRNRIMGTFIGACIGVMLSYISRGNALLCGIGIILLILTCNKLHLQGSITIGGIVMMAIMVHTDKTPLFYGFHRTFDTMVGASISFIVNALIYPYANVKRLDEMTINLWDESDKIVESLQRKEIVDLETIKMEMADIQRELNLYHNEILFKGKKEWVEKLEKHYEMASRLVLEVEILETIDRNAHSEIFDYHIDSALKIYHSYIDELQAKYQH